MPGNILIVGAKGRFGRAAVTAFHTAGWHVRAFARSWDSERPLAGVDRITGDAFDADSLTDAAKGCDVIVNALNPPYPRWAHDLPRMTASVLKAAMATGTTVMVPGNVYNYGAEMPESLNEQTAHAPTTRKGRLRVEMEQAYARAAGNGVQTLILRAGDFIERRQTGNWFDAHIADKISKGRMMYPGPLDKGHAWAYLPDVARAMVDLAERRHDCAPFDEFSFPGFGLTGQELINLLERLSGRALTVRGMPWPLIRLLGLVMPMMREVAEMAYLWRTPHAIDGSKLAAALPDFQGTPVDVAFADALEGIFERQGGAAGRSGLALRP